MNTDSKIYYVHDPMCSWCWGFRPAWLELQAALRNDFEVIKWVGGLAPDNDQPMEMGMREGLQATWRRIQQQIPGTDFNFDFWTLNTPRRSTYPACRAVISARQLAQLDDEMTLAIQRAYYLQAKNPADMSVLKEAAKSIGLDADQFEQHMRSGQLQQDFEEELHQVRAIGVNSFPSLVLEHQNQLFDIPIRYTDPTAILDHIKAHL